MKTCEKLPIGTEECLILTATHHLSHALLQHFTFQSSIPSIVPLITWLKSLPSLHPAQPLLSELEEQLLWEQIISEDVDIDVYSVRPFATLAKEARLRLALWEVPLSSLQPPYSQETARFLTWAHQFQTRLQILHRQTETQWIHQVLSERMALKNHLPKTLYLMGLDEWPPLYHRLFNSFKAYTSFQTYEPHSSPHTMNRYQLPDKREEYEQMAYWLRREKERHPHFHIGAIVPNLAEDQGLLRLLDIPNVHISHGNRLSDTPAIQTALRCLHLEEKPQSTAELMALLRSPFINNTEEDRCFIMQWDHFSRTRGMGIVSLESFSTSLQAFANTTSLKTLFPFRWKMFRETLQKHTLVQQTASQWGTFFSAALTTLGWSEGPLPFKETVETLQTLSTASPLMDFSQALSLLTLVLNSTPYLPKAPENSIPILGLLESTGLVWDKVWIPGLHADQWPCPPKPHPFLPYPLQVQHGFPHASPQREWEYAKKVTGRLLHCAETICVSSPEQEHDKKLMPSPFILSIPKLDNIPLLPTTSSITSLELFEDAEGPAIQSETMVRGGASLLTAQSLCPFQAFSRFRLHIPASFDYEMGFNRAEQGTYVHRLMEIVWQEIKTHSRLVALSSAEVGKLIEQAIACLIPADDSLNAQVEKERLKHLAYEWLAFEKKRPPFRVIACEATYTFQVHGLAIRVKLDRVDELETGQYVVIDYKTGQAAVSDWFGARPKNVQLPLYSLFSPYTEGIVYAKLRHQKFEFKGIAKQAEGLPGLIPVAKLKYEPYAESWEALQTHWAQVMERLSTEFKAGKAAVNPLEPSTCQWCNLHRLCRVNEV
ncbi:MAG TPA: PD-(D/E)XK nuclease family protein [Coxiellaceae bacterium]|nr:PD-(D/E)XK nuclease family protein [Coxiellaceae bacterium]